MVLRYLILLMFEITKLTMFVDLSSLAFIGNPGFFCSFTDFLLKVSCVNCNAESASANIRVASSSLISYIFISDSTTSYLEDPFAKASATNAS